MTLQNPYRYVAETTDKDGRPLGQLVLDVDFAPAAEWSHLHGVRSGALPALAHFGPGVIEPIYDETRGRPYLNGFQVHFDAAAPAHVAPVIDWRFFQQAVELGAARLVEAGKIQSGGSFVYRICAFARTPDTAASGHASAGEAHGTPVELALERRALDSLASGASRLAGAAWSDEDFPVFMHRTPLNEALDLARAAGERETGGILIGHLRRDEATPEIHAEITAQIPATHARAGRTHLGFTAKTWSAMSDALALRNRNEMFLGWWHSHPNFCVRCPAEQRRICALSRPFFSRDDVELHRTVFDAAFNVALLLSDTGAEHLSADLFGWRHGTVMARGCYLLPQSGSTTTAPGAADAAHGSARVLTVRENHHEH